MHATLNLENVDKDGKVDKSRQSTFQLHAITTHKLLFITNIFVDKWERKVLN